MSTKVFVGNLSFKTREPDLAKAFEVVGPVKGTNIIARGPRSLGYGFVEFEKPEDAARSVGELNKKEIDGRAVNVELARPRDFTPAAPAAPGSPATAAAPAAAAAPAPARPFRRFPQQPAQQGQQPQAAAQPAQQGAPSGFRGGRGGARGGRGGRFNGQPRAPQGAAPAGAAAPLAPQQSQAPRRQSRPARTGDASKTTLFVANLPFIVDDGGLLEIFEGLNVKEAHVVMRPNGHSKGYGFVTFENEADQMKAMQTVDKSIVEGREISVRPALAPGVVPAGVNVSAPAPVAAAPAAAAPATPAAAPAAPVAAEAPKAQ